MKNLFSKDNFAWLKPANLKSLFVAHKVWGTIIIIAVIFVGYKIVSSIGNTSGETRYILSIVTKGNLLSSVSSTGQVSSSNQIDLKSKVSSDVVSVLVKSGEVVTAGAVIARLDSTDALNALRASQISYAKLTESADPATLQQAKNDLASSIDAESQAYNSGLNDVASTFLDVPDVMTGLNSLLGSSNGYLSSMNTLYLGDTARQYRDDAATAYNTANNKYISLLAEYKSISRTSASSSITNLVSDTYDMANAVSQALKASKDALEYINGQSTNQTQSQISNAATAETSINSWINRANPHLVALLSDKNSIDQSSGNIASKQATLDKLVRGADPLDIETAQLDLNLKQENYANYTIVAPFDGMVGRVSVKVGDSASSGTVIATIVSKEQMASVSLNEVDAAKVKIGDKATLTFDAISNLTLTGVVSDLDLVGTITQGVVNYGAKIVFDANDPRVLSGMSTSAEIITNVLTDVLYVPSGAVKTDAQGSYVLVFNPAIVDTGGNLGTPSATVPTIQPVVVGTSNDISTEIVSGLSEGNQVVTRIINPTTTTAQAPSIFGAATGGGRGTTGGVRVPSTTGTAGRVGG